MPTVQELYELWAGDAELREALTRSLEPRGLDSLFETFAALGPQPGDVVLDAGARDARHAIRLVQEHGVRAVALDPLDVHVRRAKEEVAAAHVEDAVEVVQGAIEEVPLEDGSVDWIWCRDVLVHVDVRRGLRQLARVLRPGGAIVAYVTVTTHRLEEREAETLTDGLSLTADGFDAALVEAAARAAGLMERSVDRLGSEWRERMIEDGSWDPAADLLAIARLNRRRDALSRRYGDGAVAAAEGGLLWGVYQILGKLCPTVYVWERRG